MAWTLAGARAESADGRCTVRSRPTGRPAPTAGPRHRSPRCRRATGGSLERTRRLVAARLPSRVFGRFMSPISGALRTVAVCDRTIQLICLSNSRRPRISSIGAGMSARRSRRRNVRFRTQLQRKSLGSRPLAIPSDTRAEFSRHATSPVVGPRQLCRCAGMRRLYRNRAL
jgi:hypothetical protein